MATFHIHTDLYRFLERTQFNLISQFLTHQGNYVTDEGDWARRETEGTDIVSYIPKDKLKYLNPGIDPFLEEKLRVKLKVGRFVSKFLFIPACKEAGIKDKNLEEFVNLFKSYFNCDESKLKIVEGQDILKYYDMNNYALVSGRGSGTLWASCMRYPEKNKFMELYTKNSNCKMLVYLDDNGKLRSRALLWENAEDKNGNVYKIMDRIYSLYDHDVNFFKDWASKNGYLAKTEQSSKSEQYFVRDGRNVRLHLCVKLENHKLKHYPYFDTFKFYDPETGVFGNSENFKYQYYLVQNWGGLEPEQRDPAPGYGDGGFDEYVEDDNVDDRPRSNRRLYTPPQSSYGSFLGSIGGGSAGSTRRQTSGRSGEPSPYGVSTPTEDRISTDPNIPSTNTPTTRNHGSISEKVKRGMIETMTNQAEKVAEKMAEKVEKVELSKEAQKYYFGKKKESKKKSSVEDESSESIKGENVKEKYYNPYKGGIHKEWISKFILDGFDKKYEIKSEDIKDCDCEETKADECKSEKKSDKKIKGDDTFDDFGDWFEYTGSDWK